MTKAMLVLTVALAASTAARAQVELFTCDASHFNTNDGCDCGCGVLDPDCGDAPVQRSGCEFDACAPGDVPTVNDPSLCAADACGNGYAGSDEVCDDGDTTNEGGCLASCQAVDIGFVCGRRGEGCRRERCGDGVRGDSERCDDGNQRNGDGCASDCIDEDGFICYEGVPCQRTQCGDGYAEYDFTTGTGETCDDSNAVGRDGCSRS